MVWQKENKSMNRIVGIHIRNALATQSKPSFVLSDERRPMVVLVLHALHELQQRISYSERSLALRIP